MKTRSADAETDLGGSPPTRMSSLIKTLIGFGTMVKADFSILPTRYNTKFSTDAPQVSSTLRGVFFFHTIYPMTTWSAAIKSLKRGGVSIIPTDTIYGLVASALSPGVVERVYQLKGRMSDKPCIILISALTDLKKFNIKLNSSTLTRLKKLWPGKTSVILPLAGAAEKFAYLHRGTETLAFRLPAAVWLRKFIRKTGPLIAPSANPEGQPPAQTVTEAKKYFGDRVDFYLAGGRLARQASTLVRIRNGKIIVVRP